MIKGCTKKLISALIILLFFIITAPALAQSGTYNFANQSGLNTAGTKAGYSDALKVLTPENLSSQIINIVLSLLGLIFIGLIIYGGLTWMLAEGNEQKLEKAKQIILASVIGLIIVLAAYAASFFIINYFSAKTLS